MAETEFGKTAEQRIKTWLDRPEDGYSMDRDYDQMTGFYMVSRNICDFHCYKYPYQYYIESKATYEDRFAFSQLRDMQRDGLRLKSEINGCYGLVIVLFAKYKRAFIFNIKDIAEFINPELTLNELNYRLFTTGKDHEVISRLKIKSLNINKIDKWPIPYWEIQTIPSRKEILEYTGELPDFEQESDNKNIQGLGES